MKTDINTIDPIDKAIIYMHYYISQISLKHWVKGWENISIQTIEEFYSGDNIVKINLGEDWKKNGFAQMVFEKRSGVYDWYWKFKDEINIKSKYSTFLPLNGMSSVKLTPDEK